MPKTAKPPAKKPMPAAKSGAKADPKSSGKPGAPKKMPPAKGPKAPAPFMLKPLSRSIPVAGESVYTARLAKLREAIGTYDISHLLVTNPIDVGYLTGFLGGDSYLLVAKAGGKPTIISDFRYSEELEPTKAIATVFIRKRSMAEAVAELVSDPAVVRCGVQPEHMTLGERDALGAKIGPSRLLPTTALVSGLRAEKDEHEIALISRAIRIQELALVATLPTIKPGQSELEVAARLEMEMKTRGSSQPGFPSIVAAKANGSLPHYRPGQEKVAGNQALLIDWGAIFAGYHGDMTRTFTLGKWPAKVREIYQIVLDAHNMTAAALAPGKKTSEIDAIARNHIAKHGYGEFFGHGLGHGMGMNGHEEPRLTNMLAPTLLKPGNVVTIEPGIYLPGIGGVRIEDDFVVTEKGARNLCSLPKDLEWCTLG